MKSGATQFILHPTDAELERYFFSLSMFHRYYFSYRLLDRVKTILPKYEYVFFIWKMLIMVADCSWCRHTANAKSLLLKQVLLLLESDQQIENVIEFITWLIHCAQSTEYRWLTIPYIYKYHKVWYCRDRLMALLDGLKADVRYRLYDVSNHVISNVSCLSFTIERPYRRWNIAPHFAIA